MNVYEQDKNKIKKYMKLKTDRLIIQTIKTQKIKKAYYVKPASK